MSKPPGKNDMHTWTNTLRSAIRSHLCAVILSAVLLSACASGDHTEPLVSHARSPKTEQPFPDNYKAQLLEYLKIYLNDPTGVKEAQLAEPVKKYMAGWPRYIVCVRYNARATNGVYGGASDRLAIYVDGRFDQFEEKPRDLCSGAAYKPFPELERLTR
jgi:hypothetical protein